MRSRSSAVHFPTAAEPGHAAEHGDAVHLVLVVQQLEDSCIRL